MKSELAQRMPSLHVCLLLAANTVHRFDSLEPSDAAELTLHIRRLLPGFAGPSPAADERLLRHCRRQRRRALLLVAKPQVPPAYDHERLRLNTHLSP